MSIRPVPTGAVPVHAPASLRKVNAFLKKRGMETGCVVLPDSFKHDRIYAGLIGLRSGKETLALFYVDQYYQMDARYVCNGTLHSTSYFWIPYKRAETLPPKDTWHSIERLPKLGKEDVERLIAVFYNATPPICSIHYSRRMGTVLSFETEEEFYVARDLLRSSRIRVCAFLPGGDDLISVLVISSNMECEHYHKKTLPLQLANAMPGFTIYDSDH